MQSIKHKIATDYKPYVDRFNAHPYAIPVTVFLILFLLSIATLIGLNATTAPPGDSNIIELSIDDTTQRVPTRAQTVADFLENAEIELGRYDRVEPDVDTHILGEDFKVNVYRSRPVTIIDKGKVTQVHSAATTARSVAAQVGVKVHPEDRLEAEVPDNFLRDGILGEKIVIDRATPVNLNLYGSQEPTRTHARTVEELLEEKEVKLADKDKVKPAADTPIRPNLEIFVTREGVQIATVEESIPMPVDVIEDASLSFGAQAIRQHGSPGRKTVTYEIKIENGKEVSRKVIQQVVITQPVRQIVARGPQGSFGNALALLRQCEAGGNYGNKSNPSYRGAYQFAWGTWNNYAGYRDPADAPPAIQDQKATETYRARGWQPWPSCSSKLGLQDIYR